MGIERDKHGGHFSSVERAFMEIRKMPLPCWVQFSGPRQRQDMVSLLSVIEKAGDGTLLVQPGWQLALPPSNPGSLRP